MDIAYDDPAAIAALRESVRAGTAISDGNLARAWNATVDAAAGWVDDAAKTDAPPGVQEFALAVAAHVLRARESGGELRETVDGALVGTVITSSLLARYAVLGGQWVRPPRTIA